MGRTPTNYQLIAICCMDLCSAGIGGFYDALVLYKSHGCMAFLAFQERRPFSRFSGACPRGFRRCLPLREARRLRYEIN